jgi:hypothetical protein
MRPQLVLIHSFTEDTRHTSQTDEPDLLRLYLAVNLFNLLPSEVHHNILS